MSVVRYNIYMLLLYVIISIRSIIVTMLGLYNNSCEQNGFELLLQPLILPFVVTRQCPIFLLPDIQVFNEDLHHIASTDLELWISQVL